MLDVAVLPVVFAVLFPVLRVLLKKHVFQVTWGLREAWSVSHAAYSGEGQLSVSAFGSQSSSS